MAASSPSAAPSAVSSAVFPNKSVEWRRRQRSPPDAGQQQHQGVGGGGGEVCHRHYHHGRRRRGQQQQHQQQLPVALSPAAGATPLPIWRSHHWLPCARCGASSTKTNAAPVVPSLHYDCCCYVLLYIMMPNPVAAVSPSRSAVAKPPNHSNSSSKSSSGLPSPLVRPLSDLVLVDDDFWRYVLTLTPHPRVTVAISCAGATDVPTR